MDQHVRNVVRGCFYQLYCGNFEVYGGRRSMITDARRTLAAAFVAIRFYTAGVGLSTQVTRRLQLVLNAAARLVVGHWCRLV